MRAREEWSYIRVRRERERRVRSIRLIKAAAFNSCRRLGGERETDYCTLSWTPAWRTVDKTRSFRVFRSGTGELRTHIYSLTCYVLTFNFRKYPTLDINKNYNDTSVILKERCFLRSSFSVVAGIDVWNPAFDVTPHQLITGGIITELGVFLPSELQAALTGRLTALWGTGVPLHLTHLSPLSLLVFPPHCGGGCTFNYTHKHRRRGVNKAHARSVQFNT